MTDIAIRVDGLGKRYSIGTKQSSHRTLRDMLTQVFTQRLCRTGHSVSSNGRYSERTHSSIWALRDVSFEVKRGEVIGVIGRNGSGKSTLLKILSGITEPTEGSAIIRGRLGSLLEVGTGFHPELTGRENIYLNGAILGMKRGEIARKFDDIVAFAEVERFIDTPVKHYSSGMYLRLAFAVAAHLESDILLVDEVLAVGDAAFQKKCLGKMSSVAKEGRTVLFVSHNMPAITRLCERSVLLDQGKLLIDRPSPEVVGAYLTSGIGISTMREWKSSDEAPSGEVARLRSVRVKTEEGTSTEAMDIRKPIGLEMEYEVLKDGYVLMPGYDVFNEEGVLVFCTIDQDLAWRARRKPPGRYRSTAWIPGNLLAEGTMFVDVFLATHEPAMLQFEERQVLAFQVVDSQDGDSARGLCTGKFRGVVRPLLTWTTHVGTTV